MKNKILYLCLYKNDAMLSISNTYQFINQSNPIDQILHVFTNTQTKPEIVSTLKYYINSALVDFLITDLETNIIDIPIIKHYSHIVLLDNTYLYHRNFHRDVCKAITNNYQGVSAHNDNNILPIFSVGNILKLRLYNILHHNIDKSKVFLSENMNNIGIYWPY